MKPTSMMVTDIGDKMCWRRFYDVGVDFMMWLFSLNISVGPQHSKDITNIEVLSPTSACHQNLCSHIHIDLKFW